MKTEVGFWDTSAIIPLCCVQTFSMEARRLHRRFRSPVIWWGTRVEIHSGFARLKRQSEMDERGMAGAIRKWTVFENEANIVRPGEYVLEIATTLPALYGLRSQDAFQLAAALVWCNEHPRSRPFICADNRLSIAATDAGFDVIEVG